MTKSCNKDTDLLAYDSFSIQTRTNSSTEKYIAVKNDKLSKHMHKWKLRVGQQTFTQRNQSLNLSQYVREYVEQM